MIVFSGQEMPGWQRRCIQAIVDYTNLVDNTTTNDHSCLPFIQLFWRMTGIPAG